MYQEVNLTPHANPKRNFTILDAPSCVLHVDEYALHKMEKYVDCSTQEVGWLGFVKEVPEKPHHYNLYDVILFEQKVTMAETDISPEAMAKVAEKLVQEGKEDLLNDMRFWGHSHVHMGVTPSGQDDKQMQEDNWGGFPWAIRAILNKKGAMEVSLYLYNENLSVKDIKWCIKYDLQNEDNKKIVALEGRLTRLKDKLEKEITELKEEKTKKQEEYLGQLEESIQEELNEYVISSTYGGIHRSYVPPKGNGIGGNAHWGRQNYVGHDRQIVHDTHPPNEKKEKGKTKEENVKRVVARLKELNFKLCSDLVPGTFWIDSSDHLRNIENNEILSKYFIDFHGVLRRYKDSKVIYGRKIVAFLKEICNKEKSATQSIIELNENDAYLNFP